MLECPSRVYSTMNHVEILLSESLWYNTNVKINDNTVLYKEFALAGINQMCHPVDKFGKFIKFSGLVDETDLSPSLTFKWMQVIDALPDNWKQVIKSSGNSIQSDSVSFSKYSLYSEKLQSLILSLSSTKYRTIHSCLTKSSLQ